MNKLSFWFILILIYPLNLQAAVPLVDEYSVIVTPTQIDTYSWEFEYSVTNNNQQAPDIFWTGLGGLYITIPQEAIISEISVPDPYYGYPGFWSGEVRSGSGWAILIFHGNWAHSIYPPGTTASFSFRADGITIGETDATLHTYWDRYQAPNSFLADPEYGIYGTHYKTSLIGPVSLTPSQHVEIIFDFIENSIEDGTLEGLGQGRSAGNRVNALINMIISVGDLLEDDQIIEGCQQLADIYLKVDGISPPPDFVTGEAREELANLIDGMMFYCGCE